LTGGSLRFVSAASRPFISETDKSPGHTVADEPVSAPLLEFHMTFPATSADTTPD
jgi:hypothetical protein